MAAQELTARDVAATGAESANVGWKKTLRAVWTRIQRDRVSVSAGSLAYHGFLAFFPAVIAALGMLALVHIGEGTLHHLLHGIAKFLPGAASGVVTGAVRAATKRNAGSTAAVVVGIGVALWSSTSAMAVLQQILDVAYEVPTDRKFMARRVRGLPLLALTGVLGGLAAALVVFGQPIGSAISGLLPFGGTVFTVDWTAVRWVLAFALITTLFSAYYAFGPNRGQFRWRWLTPGGLLAAAVFLAASLGFSFYISTFGSYAKTYGSFAGAAIFILWMYLTSLAVLIGGELNAELEREGKLGTSRDGWLGAPDTVQPGIAPSASRTPAPGPTAEASTAEASTGAATTAGATTARARQASESGPRRAAG